MLSEKRDLAAAKKFFGQAQEVIGCTPERVTTDGHDSYPRAISEVLGGEVLHRTNRYLNNRIEQDHRGVNSATTRCAALAVQKRRPGFAARTMNSAA